MPENKDNQPPKPCRYGMIRMPKAGCVYDSSKSYGCEHPDNGLKVCCASEEDEKDDDSRHAQRQAKCTGGRVERLLEEGTISLPLSTADSPLRQFSENMARKDIENSVKGVIRREYQGKTP